MGYYMYLPQFMAGFLRETDDKPTEFEVAGVTFWRRTLLGSDADVKPPRFL
jgi:hypothetical protein